MDLKIQYAPPTSNNIFGIIFILLGFLFVAGMVKWELIDGLDSEQEWMFLGATLLLFFMGFKNLIEAASQPSRKVIILDNESITLPQKNSSKTDRVILSDIQKTKISNDIYLDITTHKNTYTIDVSWISEKDKLSQMIKELKNLPKTSK